MEEEAREEIEDDDLKRRQSEEWLSVLQMRIKTLNDALGRLIKCAQERRNKKLNYLCFKLSFNCLHKGKLSRAHSPQTAAAEDTNLAMESENSRLWQRIEKYKDVLGQMEKQQDDMDAEHVQAIMQFSLVLSNDQLFTC